MRQLINMLSITTLRPFTEYPNHFIDNIHIVSLIMSYHILSSILVTRFTIFWQQVEVLLCFLSEFWLSGWSDALRILGTDIYRSRLPDCLDHFDQVTIGESRGGAEGLQPPPFETFMKLCRKRFLQQLLQYYVFIPIESQGKEL